MSTLEELKQHIRLFDPSTDENLPCFSHSKLEVYENCRFRYNLQYNQKKRSNDTSLSLEIGTLCHKVLEEKGKMLIAGQEIDYAKLHNILENGYIETNEKTKEIVKGIKDLRKIYFEEWYQEDNASGMTYDEKMNKFEKVLHNEMEDDEWQPLYNELPFKFVWKNKFTIMGFIDRVDINRNGDYRVCDYKTSKKVFDDKKLPTAQQMGIYGCAILAIFDKLPIEYKYRFILIDDSQKALTLGWTKRLVKKLDKIFDSIVESETTNLYAPSPSPLCYYCNYCANNPNAKEFKGDCDYYSLWKPNEKTFAVNCEWNPEDKKEDTTKRKLVF